MRAELPVVATLVFSSRAGARRIGQAKPRVPGSEVRPWLGSPRRGWLPLVLGRHPRTRANGFDWPLPELLGERFDRGLSLFRYARSTNTHATRDHDSLCFCSAQRRGSQISGWVERKIVRRSAEHWYYHFRGSQFPASITRGVAVRVTLHAPLDCLGPALGCAGGRGSATRRGVRVLVLRSTHRGSPDSAYVENGTQCSIRNLVCPIPHSKLNAIV